MNTSSSTTSTAYQNPQIIRISYPRTIMDRKPDDQSLESLQRSNYLLCPQQQTSSTTPASLLSPTVSSATVPQIVNILNPLLPTIAIPNNASSFGNGSNGIHPNAKKCTFHRQCLHVQQTGQQQQQQLLHPQFVQQPQQVRISNQIPAVNRNTTQANRDAISSNVQPQFNAALLQDRYLLLDMVDGSSFYKCIDIQTQKVLACKVCTAFAKLIFCACLKITFTQIFLLILRYYRCCSQSSLNIFILMLAYTSKRIVQCTKSSARKWVFLTSSLANLTRSNFLLLLYGIILHFYDSTTVSYNSLTVFI